MALRFIALLLVCQLVGETLALWTGAPVPGPVIGMALLFLGLALRGGAPEGLSRVVDGLLNQLPLLFVPAGVGVMLHIAMLREEWLAVSIALMVSTLLTLVATGLVMTGLMRWLDKWRSTRR